MAYQFKDLSVLAYANGFTLWHYATADAATDLLDGRHFDAAAEMLRAGDIIIATAGLDDEGGAPPVALMLLVAGVANDSGGAGGKVTLRDMLKAAA